MIPASVCECRRGHSRVEVKLDVGAVSVKDDGEAMVVALLVLVDLANHVDEELFRRPPGGARRHVLVRTDAARTVDNEDQINGTDGGF